MLRLLYFISIVILFSACRTNGPGLFSKTSPHDQYARKLADAGLNSTTLGSLWLAAADKALTQPQTITLPYKQTGYFAADKPRAVGISFTATRGEKLFFRLDKKPITAFALYVDFWQVRSGAKPSRVLYIDSTKNEFDYVINDAGTYILRLQPELLRSGEYTFSISVGPSLAFPVSGKSGKIGSVWGDDRDAGARRHEGIDIFAPKRTPVVAAVDGIIGRIQETSLGGKVVWLNPSGNNISLYYAHLDEQLVSPGQRVQTGDTLGLVGNTGNARTTPSHLHFGIYTFGGAINPLPFVNPVQKEPKNPDFKGSFDVPYRLTADVKNGERTFKKNTVGLVTDAGSSGICFVTPDNSQIITPVTNTQRIDNQLITTKTKNPISLLDKPQTDAPAKQSLSADTVVKVLGYFNDYAFVAANGETGWVLTRFLY